MRRSATVTILFTDIVGSTESLNRVGERAWDGVRRQHFSVLRQELAEHDGIEVKNTGDGIMAVFDSAAGAVECSIAMQRSARRVNVSGTPIRIRIGIATGEATIESDDYFGTPVVAAARLCALAGPGDSLATSLVQALVGTQAGATFVDVGPRTLKGFDHPVSVVRIEAPVEPLGTMFSQTDLDADTTSRLVNQLDYWEGLPDIERVKADIVRALSPLPGDVVCDIGCGTGTELLRFARLVGPGGRVIGIDPSAAMLAEARRRTERAGVAADLREADGRATTLPDASCDAVRIERVSQHIGDIGGLLAEAVRITRPGGRIAIADSDWGTAAIHPGDKAVIERFKHSWENGPMAEPWAGRKLLEGVRRAGLLDASSRAHAVVADAGVINWLETVTGLAVTGGIFTPAEAAALLERYRAAEAEGTFVFAFIMFVASGRRP